MREGRVDAFAHGADSGLEIVDPGPLALIEDLGRPGHAALGVGRSGALDRSALRLANRLVGNAEDAAGIEVTLGRFEARFRRPAIFAIAGAWGDAELGGKHVEPYDVAHAAAGTVLRIGDATRGLRFMLAVRGGIQTTPVLGSRSVDTLSGVGGAPLRAGDVLPIGPEPLGEVPGVDTLTVGPPVEGTVVVRAGPGPRADWFTDAALDRFYDTEWIASASGNRIGVALEPPAGTGPLVRARLGELPSEAMVPGAVQVAHAGIPTVLLADHPVTGGYPVIAVVTAADLDALAQLRPGQGLRFRHPSSAVLHTPR